MDVSCSYCGASMPEVSSFCPRCGKPVERLVQGPRTTVQLASPASHEYFVPAQRAPLAPTLPLPDRLAAALCYLTFVPAVVFIFLKQYRDRSFVRFHAFQSLLFWAAVIGLLLLGLLGSMLGHLFMWFLLGVLAMLALFLTWVVLLIKAVQGENFRLPVLGEYAERWAGP
jgi:uncharacterized membrane protein